MASTLFYVLSTYETGKPLNKSIVWQRDTLVITLHEYLLRSAIKQVASSMTKKPGTSGVAHSEHHDSSQEHRERIELIGQAIDTRLAKLKRALSGFQILPIMLPIPSISWWHQYILLQPDCAIHEAFDNEYIVMLHTVLTSTFGLDDEQSESKESCNPKEQDDQDHSSQLEPSRQEICSPGDPLYTLAKALQANDMRQVVIIDGLDATLLIALWEYYRRIQFGDAQDIFVSTSFFPSEGLSISCLHRLLRDRYKIQSAESMENLLVCFPFIANAGLPPLLMLQYCYKENPVAILATAVSRASHPILCIDESGSIALDLDPILSIMEYLQPLEEQYIRLINEFCKGRMDESHLRDFSNLEQVGWKQFRLHYYHIVSEEALQAVVAKRVFSYITGILQLASIYQGKIDQHHLLSQIRMDDSPLVSDMLPILRKLVKVSRYVTLPESFDLYCQECSPHRRTLNRLWPLFPQKLSG